VKLIQHFIALLAAIVLAAASVSQARRAFAKAEHERVSLPDETLRNSLKSKSQLRRKKRESTAKDRKEPPGDGDTPSDQDTQRAKDPWRPRLQRQTLSATSPIFG
jgi:hypothetical protein